MKGLPNIAAILIAVFAFSLFALLAEVAYVIWRKRRFHRRSLSGGASHISGSDQGPYSVTPSKELLYFLCWKSQSRIEPAGAPSPIIPFPLPPEREEGIGKWQLGVLHGPSRSLFTIKEEERESAESSSSVEATDHRREISKGEMVFSVTDEVTIGDGNEDETTPFSTPCASPPYYTPTPSPGRETTKSPEDDVRSAAAESGGGGNKPEFVCLEVEV